MALHISKPRINQVGALWIGPRSSPTQAPFFKYQASWIYKVPTMIIAPSCILQSLQMIKKYS